MTNFFLVCVALLGYNSAPQSGRGQSWGAKLHHEITMNQSDLFVDYLPSKGKPNNNTSRYLSGARGEGDASKKRQQDRKNSGLCVVCKGVNLTGKNRCKECTSKTVAANKDRKNRMALLERCVTCGLPWKGSTLRCDSCLQKSREKWSGRLQSTTCIRCGGHRDGKNKSCSKCREELRRYSNERRGKSFQSGKCVQCGKNDLLPSGKYCEVCALKYHSRRWLEDSRKWQILKGLLESQDGMCAYSGEPIFIGDNASVDHKIPRTKGGKNSIENLQWVSWKVNRMKTDLTHEEFVTLCHVVARKFPLT